MTKNFCDKCEKELKAGRDVLIEYYQNKRIFFRLCLDCARPIKEALGI